MIKFKKIPFFALSTIVLFIGGCSTRTPYALKHNTQSQEALQHTTPTPPKSTYTHPTMRPYTVLGVTYYPKMVHAGDRFNGVASWYGPNFHGKLTSNGEHYNMWDMTAAHKTLPMNTIVEVTNKRNGKKVIVRINDRGPFVATRIIDLSKAAAKKLDMLQKGTTPVELRVLGFNQPKNTKIPTKKELKALPKSAVCVGKFALQIGSFSKIDGAMYTQERYNNIDGYKTIIKDVKSGDTRLFKVWITGFKTAQEAQNYKAKKFQNGFIIRED